MRLRAFALIAGLALLSLAPACGGSGSGAGSNSSSGSCTLAPGVTSTTITFGTSTPLSGTLAALGNSSVGAIQAYIGVVNAKGGINGRKLVLATPQDDAYDGQKAVANMQFLIERQHVFAIWGMVGGTPVNAAYPIAVKDGVPFLFPNSLGRNLTSPTNPLVYSIAGTGYAMATVMSNYIAAQHPGAKVGLLTNNTPDGQDALEGFKAGKAGAGVTPQLYDIGAASLTAQVSAFKAAGLTDVYINSGDVDYANVLKTADTLGFHPRFYSSTGTVADSMFKLAPTLVDGQHAVTPFIPIGVTTAGVTAYQTARAQYAPNTVATSSGLNAWVGGMLIEKALRDAGSCLTVKSFTAAMDRTHNFDTGGTTKPINLSPTEHLGNKDSLIVVAKGGSWQVAT